MVSVTEIVLADPPEFRPSVANPIISKENELPAAKKWGMKGLAKMLSMPKVYDLGGKLARGALRILPHGMTHAQSINPWAIARELPDAPKQSFKEWYNKNKKS